MALPSNGPISFSMISTELGWAPTQNTSLNDSNYRTLAGKPSGQISMSDFYGKANSATFTWSYSFPGSGNINMGAAVNGQTLTAETQSTSISVRIESSRNCYWSFNPIPTNTQTSSPSSITLATTIATAGVSRPAGISARGYNTTLTATDTVSGQQFVFYLRLSASNI